MAQRKHERAMKKIELGKKDRAAKKKREQLKKNKERERVGRRRQGSGRSMDGWPRWEARDDANDPHISMNRNLLLFDSIAHAPTRGKHLHTNDIGVYSPTLTNLDLRALYPQYFKIPHLTCS